MPATISVKPGEAGAASAEPKVKRAVKKREAYTGGTRNEKGLITEVPTDYDRNKQLPPARKTFANAALFYQWRADESLAAHQRFSKRAEEERALGDSGQRAEKKRMIKLVSQAAELREKLEKEMGPEAFAKLLATVTGPNGKPLA